MTFRIFNNVRLITIAIYDSTLVMKLGLLLLLEMALLSWYSISGMNPSSLVVGEGLTTGIVVYLVRSSIVL